MGALDAATQTALLSAGVQEASVSLMQRAFDHNRVARMTPLRRRKPVLHVPGAQVVVVTRRADVLEVLSDAETFGAPYAAALPGPFVLGLVGPEYTRHRDVLKAVLKPDDLLDTLTSRVSATAQRAVRDGVRRGHLDVGADLVHPALNQMLADFLGVPEPPGEPQQLWQWARDMFEDIFLNLNRLPAVQDRAQVASRQLTAHVRALVADREARGPREPRDVLDRLLAVRVPDSPDPTDGMTRDEIVFSLIGLAIGWLWHGARAALIVVDHLLGNAPAMAEASEAAAAEDHERLARVIWEVLRFRPVQPFIVRRALRGAVVAAGTDHEAFVAEGTTVLVGTHSAMWDETAIPCPARFDPTRADDQYLIFGRDTHRCMGEDINRLQLPALLAPLLAQGGIRRAARVPQRGRSTGGRLRRGGALWWDGPRPDDLRVRFTP